jgi:hypothetical protein
MRRCRAMGGITRAARRLRARAWARGRQTRHPHGQKMRRRTRLQRQLLQQRCRRRSRFRRGPSETTRRRRLTRRARNIARACVRRGRGTRRTTRTQMARMRTPQPTSPAEAAAAAKTAARARTMCRRRRWSTWCMWSGALRFGRHTHPKAEGWLLPPDACCLWQVVCTPLLRRVGRRAVRRAAAHTRTRVVRLGISDRTRISVVQCVRQRRRAQSARAA